MGMIFLGLFTHSNHGSTVLIIDSRVGEIDCYEKMPSLVVAFSLIMCGVSYR